MQSPTPWFQEQRLQLVPRDHPIAPTEFPKERSAIQQVRHQNAIDRV
jgi:hypothetical protein